MRKKITKISFVFISLVKKQHFELSIASAGDTEKQNLFIHMKTWQIITLKSDLLLFLALWATLWSSRIGRFPEGSGLV